MSLCSLQYEDFENQIKRYGYIGTVTQQHMDEVKLTKRFLKNNELKENQSRQAQYFNSDLIMVKDTGKWQQLNAKILNKNKVFHTGVFRTHQLCILAFLFTKHNSFLQQQNAFWALVNPNQSKYVTIDAVIQFLKDLQ